MQSIIEFVTIFVIFIKNKILLILSIFSTLKNFVVEIGNHKLDYLQDD